MDEQYIMLTSNLNQRIAINGKGMNIVTLKQSKHRKDNYINISIIQILSLISRETSFKKDFNDAVHACIGRKYDPNVIARGLIPVGKLRCLRNKFGYNTMVDRPQEDSFCHRYYRVNGIKDDEGIWREYPSGIQISFHHFPNFDQLHGGHRDTLIWDALEDRLFIDDQRDEYHGICYKQYDTSCQCGYELIHLCSDAGDCVNGECKCDDEFEGTECQIARKSLFV